MTSATRFSVGPSTPVWFVAADPAVSEVERGGRLKRGLTAQGEASLMRFGAIALAALGLWGAAWLWRDRAT